jgi:hypothetical protein
MPEALAGGVATVFMVALGVYWIALAKTSRRVAGTGWVWVLPAVLSIDNITFGLIDSHWTTNVWGQAGEQALSSALLAGIGLALSAAVVRTVPALRRWQAQNGPGMLGFAGGALIVAAGVELLVG